MPDYHIFWIDKYVKGYTKGSFHAVEDDTHKTLCGISMSNHNWDGGYQNAKERKPDCKKCLNKLNKIYEKSI